MKRDLSRIKVECCACKKCRCNQQHHPRDYGKPHFAVFLKLQLDRESWTCAEIKAETALMSRVFASEPGQMLKSVWLYARHPIGFAGSAVAGLMRRRLCLSAKRFTFMQPISICKGRIDLAGTSRKIRFWAGSLSASWPPWGVIPAFLAIQARQGALWRWTVLPVALKSHGELDSVFSTLVAQHPGTLQIVADSGNLDLSDRIAPRCNGGSAPAQSSICQTGVERSFGGALQIYED
jgi:hypothetical protein